MAKSKIFAQICTDKKCFPYRLRALLPDKHAHIVLEDEQGQQLFKTWAFLSRRVGQSLADDFLPYDSVTSEAEVKAVEELRDDLRAAVAIAEIPDTHPFDDFILASLTQDKKPAS